MKKVGTFLLFLILAPIFGCLATTFWYSGANTFWKPIDYFPFSVNKLIAMEPFGKEFWVETNESEIYKITYPCLNGQTCWEQSTNIPSEPTHDMVVDYKISDNKCENDNFVYPLLHKITVCITSATHAPDATWTVSLALSDNGKLWIWNRPWVDPYTILIGMSLSTILGGMVGFLAGALFLTAQKIKEK